VKVLLLENIHEVATNKFEEAGYEVETPPETLDEVELKRKIRDVVVLGVRSKMRITKAVLDSAPELLAIGAFCIGVEQIDSNACSERGVAVFNDPHSNSRSVAELVLGEIIMLVRSVFPRSAEMHKGIWHKTASGCHEIRGLTLGIIGYGKIGSQLSELAEAVGMKVIFYDVVDVLARGNAKRCATFDEVLQTADIVTLHVDGRPQNRNLFDEEEFQLMKEGSFLLNLSRGFVVDHQALAKNLRSGKIRGVAIDVFPNEPESGQSFSSPLQNSSNVILTPHIGGSTEEAQQNIGYFVSSRLLDYLRTGNTMSSVNFPHCRLEYVPGTHRLIHIHKNLPGMLLAINRVLAKRGINIERQVLDTRKDIGYAVYDINQPCDQQIIRELQEIPHTIRFRVLEPTV